VRGFLFWGGINARPDACASSITAVVPSDITPHFAVTFWFIGLNFANFFVDDYLWKFPRVDIFYYNDGLCSFAGFGRWVSVIGKAGCSSDIRSNSFQQQGFFNGNFGGLYSFSEHCIFMVPVAVLSPKCSWD